MLSRAVISVAWATSFVLLGIFPIGNVGAQDLTAMTPDQIQQLMQGMSPDQRRRLLSRQQQGDVQKQTAEKPEVLPVAPDRPRGGGGISETERLASRNLGNRILQFGYDQLGVGESILVPQTGAVQDDYILGPGDQIEISLRGQENSDFTAIVDRNGQISLPKLRPLAAAGRSLGDFRQNLLAAIRGNYIETSGFVSVSQLRQVSILVTGEVTNPGARIVTGLSSPLDAILLSGGVKKTGSLRNVKLIRNGRETTIDLYGVLLQQRTARLGTLRDGDRILVPGIGATVAIGGFVRRPAIYELPAGQSVISVRQLMLLANGPSAPVAYTTSVLRLMGDGKMQFSDVSTQTQALVGDGELVIVRSTVNASIGRVTLEGAVRTPGALALNRFGKLRDLIPSSDTLQPDAYPLFGVIIRTNSRTMQREAIPFSPLHVMSGTENIDLLSDDRVILLKELEARHVLAIGLGRDNVGTGKPAAAEKPSAAETEGEQAPVINSFGTGERGNVGNVDTPHTEASTKEFKVDNRINGRARSNDAVSMISGCTTIKKISSGDGEIEVIREGDTPEIALIRDIATLFGNRLSTYCIAIGGAVQKPGAYLVAPNTTLTEALIAARGLEADADLSNFELTSIEIDNNLGVSRTNRRNLAATKEQLDKIILKAFDTVDFRHVYSDRDGGVVFLGGEVRYPGQYNVIRSERLSSVLKRAGGLTEVAYAQGTVFLRRSVAKREEEELKRTVADMRSQLYAAMTRPSGTNSAPLSPETVTALQALLNQADTNPSLGRLSIIADPRALARQPKSDPLLEPGDSITIPKTPSTISVVGEVLRPGSFSVDDALSSRDYLAKAGGVTDFGDSSRVLIVLPDGSVRAPESSWISFGNGRANEIPPGSVIVVPRDFNSVTFRQLFLDTTQIFSQLAITAASLAVLSRN